MERIRHMADKVSARGVSALCFPKPRAIDMKRATWVLAAEHVTCPKCLAKLAYKPRADPFPPPPESHP